MAVHFKLEKEFRDFVTDTISKVEGKGFRKDSEEAKIELISVLIHTCDISSTSCMLKEHSEKWGLRCNQEFHDQWEGEKKREEEIGPATDFL